MDPQLIGTTTNVQVGIYSTSLANALGAGGWDSKESPVTLEVDKAPGETKKVLSGV